MECVDFIDEIKLLWEAYPSAFPEIHFWYMYYQIINIWKGSEIIKKRLVQLSSRKYSQKFVSFTASCRAIAERIYTYSHYNKLAMTQQMVGILSMS